HDFHVTGVQTCAIPIFHHVHFFRDEFMQQVQTGDSLLWGMYDGTGKDILLSVEGYFDKFLYDVDFLNAEQVSVNEVLGSGNSLRSAERRVVNDDSYLR